MSFDIAWNRRRLTWYKRSDSEPWQLECVLLERVLRLSKAGVRLAEKSLSPSGPFKSRQKTLGPSGPLGAAYLNAQGA